MIRQTTTSLLLMAFATACSSQGFQNEHLDIEQKIQALRDRERAAVGKTFWIYHDRRPCKFIAPKLLDKPDLINRQSYVADTAVTQVDVQELIEGTRYFRVLVNEKTPAYLATHQLPPEKTPTPDEWITSVCALFVSPTDVAARLAVLQAEADARMAVNEANRAADRKQAEDLAAEQAALAKKPGAKIGMTTKQVAEQTSWGKPESVNRTVTAGAVDEQWVYLGGGYLYFRNGKLRAIQN